MYDVFPPRQGGLVYPVKINFRISVAVWVLTKKSTDNDRKRIFEQNLTPEIAGNVQHDLRMLCDEFFIDV
jgi:hypothetical protein